MEQIALDIGIQLSPTLSRFFAGSNEAALLHVQSMVNTPQALAKASNTMPTYLWGDSASGKTHLLRGVQTALREQGVGTVWLDAVCYEPTEFNAEWVVVLMDDVQAYTAEQQQIAFSWFVNPQPPQKWILAAGTMPPADLALRDDLRSRLGWGHIYQMQVLQETERRAVLQSTAAARGIVLSADVMDFMLTRFSRDLSSLMQLLDYLDRYALATKRAITIPLLKAMLQAE